MSCVFFYFYFIIQFSNIIVTCILNIKHTILQTSHAKGLLKSKRLIESYKLENTHFGQPLQLHFARLYFVKITHLWIKILMFNCTFIFKMYFCRKMYVHSSYQSTKILHKTFRRYFIFKQKSLFQLLDLLSLTYVPNATN
jgi:hypothetical protein